MDFFKKYFNEKIPYSQELISATNIFAPRYAFRKNVLVDSVNSSVYFTKYILPADTSPEILSSQLYGSTRYVYILLLVNNIYSIYSQWPKNNSEFNSYLIKKYAPLSIFDLQKRNWTLDELTENPKRVHSYYFSNREIAFSEYKSRILEFPSYKTYYEYEFEENEKKREIYVPKKVYLQMIEKQLSDLVKNS
jgi:hypothetical protein